MKTDSIIRQAVAEDLGAIGVLWLEYMDFHRQRDAHFTRSVDGHERFKEFISRHMTSATSCMLVAEQDGRIVGYCLAALVEYPPIFEQRTYGTIFNLAVTEHCRRTGIGEKMYAAVQAWFAERGVHRTEVRVAVTNEVSTAFWRKMGFEPYVMIVFRNV